eukprot:6557400-Pyramimonas_sp.AAC.1
MCIRDRTSPDPLLTPSRPTDPGVFAPAGRRLRRAVDAKRGVPLRLRRPQQPEAQGKVYSFLPHVTGPPPA